MPSILSKIKRDYLIAALIVLIILMGAFLRVYHFSDWLHFETDQSDDILTVSPAVSDGIENLPLLGPVAAGGPLRIGPASYYIQYLSARIFGNTPPGHAAGVLIFSIASLPLFYFFSRRYFSQNISLALLAVFSFSFYLILYSRFSWNPNLLPFFALAFGYALLKSLDKKEPRKNWWLVGMASALAILTQLHFNALFVFPPIALGMFLWRRPKFSWKAWVGAIGLFLLLYFPVIISDIRNNGENSRNFFKKIISSDLNTEETEKEKNDIDEELSENFIQTIRYTASNLFLIVTGEDTINGKKLSGTSWGIICESCAEDIPARLSALILLPLALGLAMKSLIKEKVSNRQNFLVLSLLWFFISFSLFIFLRQGGLNIYPRFFLIIAPLGLVFLGYLLEKIPLQKNKLIPIGLTLFIILLVLSNLNKLRSHFNQLESALVAPVLAETEDKFPNTNRITLELQIAVTDYIRSKQKQTGWPVYLVGQREYKPVIWYQLEKEGISYYDNPNLADPEEVYAEGHYFFIFQTVNTKEKEFQKDLKKYQLNFHVLSEKQFGIITVIEFASKPEAVTQQRQAESKREKSQQKTDIEKMVSWKEFFEK